MRRAEPIAALGGLLLLVSLVPALVRDVPSGQDVSGVRRA